MSELLEEVRLWNTPAIGAFLLFRFTQGYIAEHADGAAPVAINHFIALPILTNERLKSPISNMRADLQSFVRSFEDSKSSDVFLDIQERIKQKKVAIWSAIDFAVANGLLFWDFERAKLYARTEEIVSQKGKGLKESLKKDGEKAEILGRWFAQHDIHTICAYLKIVL